jgi:polyisoprenoid-binding protein YceI
VTPLGWAHPKKEKLMKRSILTTVAMAVLSFSVSAATIDQAASTFNWKGSKRVGKEFHVGTVKLKSAKATFEGEQVKSGEFVMDMKSIDVTDLSGEWKKKFLSHIKSGDFFEVEKYPTATLKIIEVMGAKAKGTLKVKDKTQPVEIAFKKKGMTYEGKLTFDRTKFGVIYGSGNFFKELTADKIIKDKVEIDFKVVTKS